MQLLAGSSFLLPLALVVLVLIDSSRATADEATAASEMEPSLDGQADTAEI